MTIDTTPRVFDLTDELIDRCGERAATYDRDNTFFDEDFEELKKAGYLLMAVPEDLGGFGLNLAQCNQEMRRLAYRAPATALALNMHVYWTGVAEQLRQMGDDSLTWMLEEAVAGEVFAAGHGEPGNDMPLLYSTARAEPVDGGYKFHAHKIFGTLSPVWTRFGIHAADNSDPDNPKIVHAFMPRDTEGYKIVDTWDTLGMRATQSQDTVLEGAFVPDKYIARVVPAGLAGADEFVLSIFAWAETAFANIYYAIANRAMHLAVAGLQKKTSIALDGRTLAWHPLQQHKVAEMVLALDGMEAHIDRVAADWVNGVDYGEAWPLKLISVKHHAVEGAKKVVDIAMDTSGGSGMFKSQEMERLYRDVRCGGFHPANDALVHEFIGQGVLGVLGVEPRF